MQDCWNYRFKIAKYLSICTDIDVTKSFSYETACDKYVHVHIPN